ncbi:hypothetical protein NPIL_202451 [Nephila pilipes]|uniref:Uncharacterized protein n=1 Tax=Nephila pilipes TaxID=299642 RepID=A0A8X6IX83_NEPPI|nr:hypothetical protein NPIL_202451 [Nephila pilipes]
MEPLWKIPSGNLPPFSAADLFAAATEGKGVTPPPLPGLTLLWTFLPPKFHLARWNFIRRHLNWILLQYQSFLGTIQLRPLTCRNHLGPTREPSKPSCLGLLNST